MTMCSKKDYVVITPFFPARGDFRGGYIYDFVKAVEATGKYRRVLIFKPTLSNDESSYEYEGKRVFLFKNKSLPSYLFNGVFNKYNARRFVRRFLAEGFSPKDVAVAHAHVSTNGACALELKRLNDNIITLLHHHDADPYTVRNGRLAGNWLNLWVRGTLNRWLFEKIDVHVCISRYVEWNLRNFPQDNPNDVYKSYLNRLKNARRIGLKGANIRRSIVLYNGVDRSIFYQKEKKLSDGRFVVGCIGNFMELKDQITLIKAVERLYKNSNKGIELRLVGSGPTKTYCEEYVKSQGIEGIVKFLKEVNHNELNDFYNDIDLFVLPSYFEGFGCVLTEALACGTPFMTCYNAGAAEYLTAGDFEKFTFRPWDVDGLAERINKYVENPYIPKLNYNLDINKLVAEFIDKL